MRRVACVGALALVAVSVAGCAAEPAIPVTLDDVASERIATIDGAEREKFDLFLAESGGRLVELGLPVPEFHGLVALDEVDAVVSKCIIDLNPRLQVARVEGGFTVTYFGTVGETYDRLQWTIESCNAQYSVVDLAAATPAGPVEVAWRFSDTTQRVMPCLRSIGVTVPSAPSAELFAHLLGTPREFSPFSLVAADPATLVRALALCPPTATVLQAHLDGVPVGGTAQGDGS